MAVSLSNVFSGGFCSKLEKDRKECLFLAETHDWWNQCQGMGCLLLRGRTNEPGGGGW